ncbi:MAG: DUF4422 domain-containing protein [Clostridiales bacterium]|nr:DUF4422 domain-containing protein [Clostridiales bacterium]
MKVKIIVAAHKKYWMPQDSCYLPVHVGKQGKEPIGYQGDDEGENISEKNPWYCELTGMYWMWKNVQADYYGLVHYRRYFTVVPPIKRLGKQPSELVLTERQVKRLVKKYDVILPKKRNYVVETIGSHYAHTHYKEHLEITKNIIKELCPAYEEAFEWVMSQRKGHMFNMFIMKKELFYEYCEWLFPILENLEQQVDITEYDAFQARYVGRVSEILLNVWIHQKEIAYHEIPVISMEKIKWGKKLVSFFKAKYLNEKYNGSF